MPLFNGDLITMKNNKTKTTILILMLLASTSAFAEKKMSKKDPSIDGERAGQVLSDLWYTITLKEKVHYGYYNDRAELKQGKLFFKNQLWKNEEGYINEEQVGVFSENNPELTPLFFNFHSTYRTTETTIDGTVQSGTGGNVLTVKVKKGGQELPLIKKNLPSKIFFSSVFPLWLERRMATLKPGQTQSFLTILEDSVDSGFETAFGRIQVEKPDAFATKSATTKITVTNHDQRSIWYVDAKGNPVRIEMPEQHAVVERVAESVATKFLAASAPAKSVPKKE